ncbi:MAG: Transcription regulator [contains diacylglycerol kinase catalytic domain] [uncultured Rubrobacteraceae bacterium]|uniref:Transcription regulator [contains diacylglycerol kinase catalytic domain] n=1 Tax=uncultured Rubrobacteraceae bacterium TaxID=349277 RepID=A0A6J4RBF1_9ACTN|nr:MAG: Transcription regulator [contains diacylglycerol kinase catalytic domain] [uncultured Rubrobacteraceae bacterium]
MQGAALIVNARSRTGERAFEEATKLLAARGVEVGAGFPVQDPSRLAETVRSAVLAGHDPIIIGGGDGSVSSTVDFLAHHHSTLGLLPLGTANDFARTLEIPTSLEGACETIARGNVVDVDLGLAGDNYYVNVASVGLSVAATHALSPFLKKNIGPLAYPVAALKAFVQHEPFVGRLTFPDGDHASVEYGRLLQVAVGNGRFYGGGMIVAPGSGMDDGTLDVYAIVLGRTRDLFGIARYLRSGDFVKSESVDHFRTSRVVLETEPDLPVNVDGELVAHTPEEFSVAPNALRVIVPEGSTAARYDG